MKLFDREPRTIYISERGEGRGSILNNSLPGGLRLISVMIELADNIDKVPNYLGEVKIKDEPIVRAISQLAASLGAIDLAGEDGDILSLDPNNILNMIASTLTRSKSAILLTTDHENLRYQNAIKWLLTNLRAIGITLEQMPIDPELQIDENNCYLGFVSFEELFRWMTHPLLK